MEHQEPSRSTSHRKPPGTSIRSLVADYHEMAKARLGALVVLTAYVG
jgi:hypothetical protein